VTEECYAIKRFRPYIEMMPLTVITDHSSLKLLMSLRTLVANWQDGRWFFFFNVQSSS